VKYIVKISKQADKTIAKAPQAIQQKFALWQYGEIKKGQFWWR